MRIAVMYEAGSLEVVNSAEYGWCFFTHQFNLIHGFESWQAGNKAAHTLATLDPLRPMMEYSPDFEGPQRLYQPFKTPATGWGFFDRAGELHATFPTEAAAEIVASKLKGGSL